MNEIQQTVALVLNDWSYWTKSPGASITRDLLGESISLQHDLVTVIQGVRRAGKSTLLTQILSQKKLDPQSCYFINFEDPRLSDVLDYSLLDEVVNYADSKSPENNRYFFLDEIQNVTGWEKWLRLKVDRPGRDYYIITGSNASLLSGELGTVLTGRHQSLELFPFNYSEYKCVRPNGNIESYLDEGGFPRSLDISEPAKLLRQYFIDIIERDVRRKVAVRSSLTLSQLAKAVFESTGSEVSQRSLAKVLGTTADTIGSYLDACVQAYLILPCPYFSFSERKRTVRNRKFYPVDLGLCQAVITRGGKDLGKRLETIVFHALRRRYREVFYWRAQGEVDFVVQDGTTIIPLQVSWSEKKERHSNALEEFYQHHPSAAESIFVSRDNIEEFLSTT